MQLKLDIKTLIIGIVLGFVIAIAIGAGGTAEEADFGVAIQPRGTVLVKANDGSLYIIDPDRATAEMIEYRSGPFEGRFFTLNGPLQVRQLPRD